MVICQESSTGDIPARFQFLDVPGLQRLHPPPLSGGTCTCQRPTPGPAFLLPSARLPPDVYDLQAGARAPPGRACHTTPRPDPGLRAGRGTGGRLRSPRNDGEKRAFRHSANMGWFL